MQDRDGLINAHEVCQAAEAPGVAPMFQCWSLLWRLFLVFFASLSSNSSGAGLSNMN